MTLQNEKLYIILAIISIIFIFIAILIYTANTITQIKNLKKNKLNTISKKYHKHSIVWQEAMQKDKEALAHDWKMIGDDLNSVIRKSNDTHTDL